MSIDEVSRLEQAIDLAEMSHNVSLDDIRAAIDRHVAEEVAREREECARKCDAIEDQFNERERRTFPELKTDAATGAGACGYAIRARAEKDVP